MSCNLCRLGQVGVGWGRLGLKQRLPFAALRGRDGRKTRLQALGMRQCPLLPQTLTTGDGKLERKMGCVRREQPRNVRGNGSCSVGHPIVAHVRPLYRWPFHKGQGKARRAVRGDKHTTRHHTPWVRTPPRYQAPEVYNPLGTYPHCVSAGYLGVRYLLG